MKKCDAFKDMILTDYIDGELDKNAVASLEGHLLNCAECRVFLKEVKNIAALPFQQAQPKPVPAELWDTIKHNIEHEAPVANPMEEFLEKLKGLLSLPRMVPVFASFALMFLAGSATLNTIHLQQAKAQDQGEYLVSLLTPTSSSETSDNNEPGTPIEHYFL